MPQVDWQTIWPMVVFAAMILAMFWWVVIRPTQRQQRSHHELIDNLAVGEKIITAGGIYGTIVGLHEGEMDLEVAGGCVITFDRRAARRTRE